MESESRRGGAWQWAIAGAVLLAGLCVAYWRSSRAAGRAAETPAAPELPMDGRQVLRIKSEGLDFEEVALGETRRLKVEVENTGTRKVTVLREVVVCPCVKAEMEDKVIPPGESRTLVASFTGVPGRRSYVTEIALISDESGPCRYALPLRGKVRLDFAVEPEALAFGLVRKGESRELGTVVRRADGAAFAIREIKSGRPEFGFEWEAVEDGRAFRVRATARGLKPGTYSDEVQVVVDPPEKTNPVLLVSADVQGDLEFVPPVASGKDGVFVVDVRSRSGAPVEVRSVRDANGHDLEFKAEPAEGGAARLRIEFKTAGLNGPPVGEFLIEAAPEDEPMPLPYRVELASAPRSP